MPRADEPRVTVRFSAEDHRVLEAAAAAAGVKLGTIVRVAAVRYGVAVASELGGRVGRRPVPASSGRPVPASAAQRAQDAEEMADVVAGQPVPRALGPVVIPKDGPERAEFFRRLARGGS